MHAMLNLFILSRSLKKMMLIFNIKWVTDLFHLLYSTLYLVFLFPLKVTVSVCLLTTPFGFIMWSYSQFAPLFYKSAELSSSEE